MISVIHMEHAKLSAISNIWHARYPAQWRRMLAIANLLDVPLLALVYQRLRELQDATAREAFERQEDAGVVAWEWRQAIVDARGCKQCTQCTIGPRSMDSRSSTVSLVGGGQMANVESVKARGE